MRANSLMTVTTHTVIRVPSLVGANGAREQERRGENIKRRRRCDQPRERWSKVKIEMKYELVAQCEWQMAITVIVWWRDTPVRLFNCY